MCYKEELAHIRAYQCSKRQKLSDTAQVSVASGTRSCQNEKTSGERSTGFGLDQPALDLVISDRFLDVVCACDACEKTFSRVKKLVHAIENRDEATKALETNLEGEVNHSEVDAEETKVPTSLEGCSSMSAEKTRLNPEKGCPDEVKVVSDYLLSKFFDNLDHEKFGVMAKNMTPEAQFFLSKNLNDLRDKFAEFVKRFIKAGNEEDKVIKTEDVCQFFEEMSALRKQNLAKQLSGHVSGENDRGPNQDGRPADKR